MKANLKILVVQMNILSNVFGTDVRKTNVEHACKLLEKHLASNKEVDIAVLPEEFYAGAGYGPISLQDDEDTIKETVFEKLCNIAVKYNVNIVGALSTKFNETGFKGNNIGFVIERNGKLAPKYQERFHQTESEKPFSYSGEEYVLFDLDCAKLGMVIGVDIFYPEIARNMVLKGAEILINPILAPGAKEKDLFPDNLYRICSTARAMENQIFVVTVNGVGQFAHVDMPIFGESIVSGPTGILQDLGNDEEVKVVELDESIKNEAKKNMDLYALRNDKMCSVI